MSDWSRTRHNLIRSYKKYLSNAENNALHSLGVEKDIFLRRAGNCKRAVDRLQHMTDHEFETRFVFGSERLSILEDA